MASERAPITASLAQTYAWFGAAVLAAVSALFYTKQQPAAYVGSLILDVSQHLAAGLAIGGAVYLWSRIVPNRGAAWVVAVAIGALAVSEPFVAEDVEGAATKLTVIPLPANLRVHLVAVALSLLVPLAAYVGSRISFAARLESKRARWLPPAAIAMGFGVQLAHARLFDLNYPGIHLLGTLVGAIFAGACATGLPLPVLSRRVRVAAVAVLGLMAASPLATRPRDSWTVQAMRRRSAVFAPYFARLHEDPIPDDVVVTKHDDSTPIAPTSPRLVGRPSVVFWTIDALRPDLLRDHCDRLKNLCALAAESTTFSNARSPAPATTASLTSLYTGRYYSQIYWQDATTPFGAERLFPQKDTSPRFPQILTDAGVTTINTSAHAGYTAEYGVVTGFATEAFEGKSVKEIGKLTRRMLREPGQLFIYAHILEPHAPYNAAGDTPFEKYLGEVAVVDREVGALRDAIAKSKQAASTILIISADHGEAFQEHGVSFHGSTVYDEMVRIPLIVHIPRRAPRMIDEPVSLVDLGPTILDLFGQETPGTFMGQSLVPMLAGGTEPLLRPIVVDSSRWQQALVFPDGYKVIYDMRSRTSELYDTNADPAEANDLSDAKPELLRERVGTLRAFMNAHTLKRTGYKKPYRK